ncbi:AraC family transcriptional regulator [Niveispirillum lacus]|uniref:AraC family transcriptional regulator n=1 Tax=Niveispirillum lacus TaxID=1981099 RepID=A0A255YYR5_9PROT|nr:Ada metal-binding domain-containing protein [Niveispirillum lacus]OYQ34338.1 AraC family transcriptional regulator [Niveispirillum lacus]
METLDPTACYRAVATRDARFDGRFFTAVLTTGIYCRPICPARTPKAENCRFYHTAAAAQEAGFRPCLRCRPEAAPDLAVWRGTSNTVSRGLALIADGALDGDDASVDTLAGRLGVGERQLRRLFKQHLGASPVTVAQTRRVLFAKQLLHETALPMAEVALASGFGSIRRFNETFQALYGRPPRELRRQSLVADRAEGNVARDGVILCLRYRPPLDWPDLLSAIAAQDDPAEQVTGEVWRRTLPDGQITVTALPAGNALRAVIHTGDIRALSALAARLRRRFDLSADMASINDHLSQDPTLAPLVADRPGRRLPAPWDGPAPLYDGEQRWHPWGAYARRHLNLSDLPLSLEQAS